MIYGDFVKAINFQLSGDNPQGETSTLQAQFEHLEAHQITIPGVIHTMILIGAIPQKWSNATSFCLQSHDMTEANKLDFGSV